jgi:signal transduction histidine kinase
MVLALPSNDGRVARHRRAIVPWARTIMKTSFGLRLWILTASLLLVAGGMIYVLSFAWSRVQQLEAKLTSSQIARFQLASEVRRELQSLNTSVLRYALLRDPQQWSLFEQASRDLDRWIDDHDPSMNPQSPLTTVPERQLFQQLNRVYDEYLAAAGAVHSNAQPALVSSDQLAQLDLFDAQADRMRELVRQLSNAHRAAEAEFLAKASASLAGFRRIIIASVLMLLALVGAVGWVIYRDTIAPLQTKLVLSQSLLERQQKLATLGTLAAGIAHEIRNPLTSLKARLYTLEKHLQNVPAARKDTDIISAEISRLERIVQDVLSFARPSDPRLETLSAGTMLREVQGLVSPDLESRGVQLVVESGPELFIRADSGHLKQVLINLVRNATEAIDGAGTVTLRTRTARAPLGGHERNAVVLEVADTGRGILPEVQKRLFDPFFSTKETGTGLGLPIAARIVEKHGGLLQYQTQPGHGSTFGVVLPREIHDTPGNANHHANTEAGGGQANA